MYFLSSPFPSLTHRNPTPDDSLGFVWEPVKNGNLKYLALQPSPVMEEDYRKEVSLSAPAYPLSYDLNYSRCQSVHVTLRFLPC